MKHIKLTQTILFVEDQQNSTEFYSKIFRKDPDLNVPGMTEYVISDYFKIGIMPNNGIFKILGDSMPHPGSGIGIPRCELYFYVEDIKCEFDNAINSGAKLISPISVRSWNDTACYFSDPDGHILVFAQRI